MVGIAVAEQTPMTGSRFQQHTVSPWVWWTVRDTMLHGVNIYSGPERFVQAFLLGPFHNLLHREVGRFRVFTVKQCGRDPHFVCHLEFCVDYGLSHRALGPRTVLHLYKVLMNCQLVIGTVKK